MRGECKTCEFFRPDEDEEGLGLCRRYAPRPISGNASAYDQWAHWPQVGVLDWCGEYRQRWEP